MTAVKTFLDSDFDHGVRYIPKKPRRFNLIMASDSYKFSHPFVFPDRVTGMFSYIEARTGGKDIIIPFGMQRLIQNYFQKPINKADIDEAEAFAQAHGEPFSRKTWEYVLQKYNGMMPLTIRTVPEGMPIKSGNALVTIMCLDEKLEEHVFWLCTYFETVILRGMWYPSTIASMDYDVKNTIRDMYERTGADLNTLPFSYHDFGGRGVTCHEQAQIGGGAHMVNFMGSDTVEGVSDVGYWYNDAMPGFSVPATEHSVECSFGLNPEEELEYLRHVLKNLGKPGGIVSIVIDGKDVYRAAETLCTTMKDEIITSGCKVVFRPDSGDMMEVVPRILRMQAATFGATKNARGFLKINHVGIIQGDGVDHLAIRSLLGKMMAMGFAADNVLFGSGGALLQKVNRDLFKWAQKAAAIRIREDNNDVWQGAGMQPTKEYWVGIAKDPITDPGKKSKEGVLTLARSKMTGQLSTIRIDQGMDSEFEDIMVTIYRNGEFFNFTTLAEVRARCA